MTGNVRYDDGRVCLDHEALTLRRYYFPFGTSERIPYTAIRGSWLTGKGRLWGSSHPRYWLPLDRTRRARTPRWSSTSAAASGPPSPRTTLRR